MTLPAIMVVPVEMKLDDDDIVVALRVVVDMEDEESTPGTFRFPILPCDTLSDNPNRGTVKLAWVELAWNG